MTVLPLLWACTSGGDPSALYDPATCASCHPHHVEEWAGSMHAYAAEDPIFLAMNAKGQEATGGALGDFCVRCHAPLAVALGLTDDGLNLDTIAPELKGITCYFCHNAIGVDGTHNNPITLAMDRTMRGGIADPRANGAHRSRYSPLLDRDAPESAQLCGSCHDVVNPGGIHIERTYLEWRESVYDRDDRPDQRLTCGRCHMESVDAPVAEMGGRPLPTRRRHAHTWPGVDIALTPFPDRERQRSLVEDALDTVLGARLCVTVDPVRLESTILVDLENLAAGHSFPSGAAVDRRVWIELRAYDGDTLAWSTGSVDASTAVDELDDPNLWTLGEQHFDVQGRRTHLFWEAVQVLPELLPAPTAFQPSDPRWRDTHRTRTYIVEGVQPDRVELAVHMRPFPLDVARELVHEGRLDAAMVDAIPTFTLASASLTWTPGQDCVP